MKAKSRVTNKPKARTLYRERLRIARYRGYMYRVMFGLQPIDVMSVMKGMTRERFIAALKAIRNETWGEL